MSFSNLASTLNRASSSTLASSLSKSTASQLLSAVNRAPAPANPYYNNYPASGVTNNEFAPARKTAYPTTPIKTAYPTSAFTPTTPIFGRPVAKPSTPINYAPFSPINRPTTTAPKPATSTAKPASYPTATSTPRAPAASYTPAAQPQQQQAQAQEAPQDYSQLANSLSLLMAPSQQSQAVYVMPGQSPQTSQPLPGQAGRAVRGQDPGVSNVLGGNYLDQLLAGLGLMASYDDIARMLGQATGQKPVASSSNPFATTGNILQSIANSGAVRTTPSVNTGRDVASIMSLGSPLGSTYAPNGGGASSAALLSNPNILSRVLNSSVMSPTNSALTAMLRRPAPSTNDYVAAMGIRPSSGGGAVQQGGGMAGAMGGMGGGGGGGMSGMLQQLAGQLGGQAAAAAPKEPEKPKTFDELHPTGTPSGANYKDPRLSSPSFLGGGTPADDVTHGNQVLGQLVARSPATTPTTPTAPTPPKPPTTPPKTTTPKPTTPTTPTKTKGRWW